MPPAGNGNRQRGADGVALGIVARLLVGELQRLAGPRVVDFDAGAFAAAAGRVHELGGAGACLLGQERDAEGFAAGLEQGVLGVGVLGEEPRHRRARPERAVRVGTAWKLSAAATAALRDHQRRHEHEATGEKDSLHRRSLYESNGAISAKDGGERCEREMRASHATGPPSRDALRRGTDPVGNPGGSPRRTRDASERSEASHANGASRRSGERESVQGSPRGEAPRI